MVMIVSSLDTGMYVASGEPRKIMLRSRRDLMNSDTYILFVRRFSAGTVTWLK